MYTVHRYFLCRDSPILKAMFERPRVAGSDPPTYDLSDQVNNEELEHLLWIYYNPEINVYEAPPDTWRNILRLADMWQMARIKTIALEKLMQAELPTIERIMLCERHNLTRDRTALGAYLEVCTREAPLTAAEFQTLGINVVLKIVAARERIIANRAASERVPEEDIVADAMGLRDPARNPPV
ncbi:hypothetical protein C8R44DRAFT_644958 [Mycena epipterygia]|nr:hypothetical protein C8R44DRAFT_644958 [Mycena epipterygia]